MTARRDDLATIAALALLAMCVVTSAHEAFGHGTMCLLIGGHPVLISTSEFACTRPEVVLAPAGPAGDVLVGTIALVLRLALRPRAVAVRLLLVLITAFSYFWESGYVVQGMLVGSGDWADLLLPLPWWARVLIALPGAAGWIATAVGTARALRRLQPDPAAARRIARTAWVATTVGAFLVSLFALGDLGWRDVLDSELAYGLAALPLLWIPRGARSPDAAAPALPRSVPWMAAAAAVLVAFAATLGHGIHVSA